MQKKWKKACSCCALSVARVYLTAEWVAAFGKQSDIFPPSFLHAWAARDAFQFLNKPRCAPFHKINTQSSYTSHPNVIFNCFYFVVVDSSFTCWNHAASVSWICWSLPTTLSTISCVPHTTSSLTFYPNWCPSRQLNLWQTMVWRWWYQTRVLNYGKINQLNLYNVLEALCLAWSWVHRSLMIRVHCTCRICLLFRWEKFDLLLNRFIMG